MRPWMYACRTGITVANIKPHKTSRATTAQKLGINPIARRVSALSDVTASRTEVRR